MSVVQMNSPQSVIITIGGGTITWSSQFDQHQTHYEIQYRLKNNGAWSTLGKKASTLKQTSIQDIYNTLRKSFSEIYYRVVMYYSYTVNAEVRTGYEYSNAYLLIFVPESSYDFKHYDGKNTHVYPLYDNMSGTTIECVHIEVNNEKKFLPLVDEGNIMQGQTKILNSRGEKKFFAVDKLKYYGTEIRGSGYLDIQASYTTYDKYTYITGYRDYQPMSDYCYGHYEKYYYTDYYYTDSRWYSSDGYTYMSNAQAWGGQEISHYYKEYYGHTEQYTYFDGYYKAYDFASGEEHVLERYVTVTYGVIDGWNGVPVYYDWYYYTQVEAYQPPSSGYITRNEHVYVLHDESYYYYYYGVANYYFRVPSGYNYKYYLAGYTYYHYNYAYL